RAGALPLVALALAVLNVHVPRTAVIAAQVELDGRVHALGSVRVELLRHLCENILGGHQETPPLKWWWGLTGLGRLGGRSLSRYGALAGAAARAPRTPRPESRRHDPDRHVRRGRPAGVAARSSGRRRADRGGDRQRRRRLLGGVPAAPPRPSRPWAGARS